MDYADEKSTTCVSAGRVLPPLAGSAYGMTNSAKGVFLKPLLLRSLKNYFEKKIWSVHL